MAYEYITKYTSPNRTPTKGRAVRRIIIHWWDDPARKPAFAGVVNWLCRKGGNSSAHYVVESGRVACLVAPRDIAWHAGNWAANRDGIGLELNPRRSDGDYETAGELIAELWRTYGKIPLARHRDVSDTPTSCPGSYDLGRLQRIAERYYKGGAAPAPSKPATTKPAATKPAKKGKWPATLLPVTDKHTAASHEAYKTMLAGAGYRHSSLTRNIQNWLRGNGYYTAAAGWVVDGKFGAGTTRELQRFLKDRGFYKGQIDGHRGPMTIRAEIAYINSQAKYYRR